MPCPQIATRISKGLVDINRIYIVDFRQCKGGVFFWVQRVNAIGRAIFLLRIFIEGVQIFVCLFGVHT